LIFRTHRRSFLAGRPAWRVPVAVRFLVRRCLFRASGQVLVRMRPVEIICFLSSIGSRNLVRALLDHLRRNSSYSFGSTKDFRLCFIHSSYFCLPESFLVETRLLSRLIPYAPFLILFFSILT